MFRWGALFSSTFAKTMMGVTTHRETLSHDTALLHSARPTKLPHVVAVLAVAALFPAAGGTSLAPHSSAPQSRDRGAFGAPLTERFVEGGAQARTVKDGGRGSWGLIPCWLYKGY